MGKKAELERREAGEAEKCEADADLTRLEELESEVLCFSTTTYGKVSHVPTHSKSE